MVLNLQIEFGLRVAYLRHNLKMTQLQLALEIGTAQGYVALLEDGRGNPTLETIAKLARALHVSFEELFAGVNSY